MTCREYAQKMYPEFVDNGYLGGVSGCPSNIGLKENCKVRTTEKTEVYNNPNILFYHTDVQCRECWNSKAIFKVKINLKRNIKRVDRSINNENSIYSLYV